MLEVIVNVNREIIVAQLHAVRTNPKTKTIEDGTECTYNIVYNNVTVGTMKGTYGCGVDLAIQLLERWKKDSHLYKTISVMKQLGELK